MTPYARLFAALAAALLAASGATAQTPQNWPEKPLRMVIAFTAGGLIDTFARTIQPRLAENLGQPIIVENRGGAGGTVAESLVAKSAPDGYTLLVTADSPVANPHLYRNLEYSMLRDLAPVSLLVRVPLVLLVNPSVPANTLPEFIAYVRAQGGRFAYATTGSGTSNHLSMEVLKRVAGIDMTHVPYKGGAQVMADVMGGQVPATLIAITLAAPQVRAGKLKAIAVTGSARAPLLPQVQTFAEGGFPDFPPGQWCGLWVPAGTPQPIIQRLHAETAKAIRSPEVQARIQELGGEVVMSSTADFTAFVRAENARLGELVREHKITAD